MHLDDALASIVPALRADPSRHVLISGAAEAVASAAVTLGIALSDDANVCMTSSLAAPSATSQLLWVERSAERTTTQIVRAFLRQDPDVVIVHDLVDADLFHLLLNVALTGHQLVVATTQSLDEVATLEAVAVADGLPLTFSIALVVDDDGVELRSRDVGTAEGWGAFVAPTIIERRAVTATATDLDDDDDTAFADLDHDDGAVDDADDDEADDDGEEEEDF